ncbi:MAG: M23 family metallopeptidase [Vicinamibacteraceae bacterium]|nr:M23 family metallopeptidase [Vicinamibacteraceae bacterium]
MRKFLGFLFLLVFLAAIGLFVYTTRAAAPAIAINQPGAYLGAAGTFDVTVTTPGGELTRLDVALEQNGQTHQLFTLPGREGVTLKQEDENTVRVTGPVGKRAVPALANGAARLVVTAERPLLEGYRSRRADAARDLTVRLTPPVVAVVSRHHFINHGGSEVVVYRVTPAEAASGVRVGDREYPGFAASGAVQGADPSLKVAFFALAWDQDRDTPIHVFARDEAGNEARSSFDYQVFPKPFRKSRIELNTRFIERVVPEILAQTPDLPVDDPNNLEAAFLAVNGELRRRNNAFVKNLAAKTSSSLLWSGPFKQLSNTQVEANFADQRTYFYEGREIDQQVHLGFDLASLANAPVEASNAGAVVFAGYLGIFGQCVVVDHGMGVQSLYAHLSSIDVKEGDKVARGQTLGRTGMTGLAGGDHLHFTMLVNGESVTPVDWWSAQWVEDRVLRKFREAGAPGN